MTRKLIIVALSFLSAGVFRCTESAAQSGSYAEDRYGTLATIGGNPFEGEEEEDGRLRADTTRKIRKPLESYFFDDSTRKRPNFSWYVDTYRNRVDLIDIDTMLNDAQIDYPYLGHDVGDVYLGNLGGASIPVNYFRRPEYRDAEFIQGFDTYIFTPANAPFYNVKLPFTQMGYIWAGQKKYLEENLNVIHAQNISPSSGFNINYKSRGTRGVYRWQGARAKNLSVAFSHTGKRYSLHAGYIYNSEDLKENGGVANDADLSDPDFEITENIAVNLYDARNRVKNNTYYVVQSYGIPLRRLSDEDFSIADRSSLFVGHSFEYSRYHKKYTDTKAQSGDFYDDWFISPVLSRDSIFESKLSNRVFVQIQPWDRNAILGIIDAGIGMDNHHYYQFDINQYGSGNNDGVDKTSYYVYGSVEGKLRQYLSWGANMQYNPWGYRSQDIKIGGNLSLSAFIKGHPITLEGKIDFKNNSPGYWSENYYSNHYIWSNSFSKESETRISGSLRIPHTGTQIGVWHSLLTDKIYFDRNRLAAQYGGNVNVTGLYVREDIRLGGFNFNHRVLLQWSTNEEVVPVPMLSAYLSYFFQFTAVKNVLVMRIGVDGRYNTKYYAFAYNPATAQFYNQREKQIGEYPLLDAYVTAKWKRMRIYLKMTHVNEDTSVQRDSFSALHHPLNKRVMKLGVSWAFYD